MAKESFAAEHVAEAERLKLLSVQTQRDFVSMYRHKAKNPKLSSVERQAARERAAALSRLLKLPSV